MIRCACQHCGQEFSIAAEHAGQWARCRKCGQLITVTDLRASEDQPAKRPSAQAKPPSAASARKTSPTRSNQRPPARQSSASAKRVRDLQDAEDLPQAEVIYVATPVNAPAAQDDLFATQGDPFAAHDNFQAANAVVLRAPPPPPPPPQPVPPAARSGRARRSPKREALPLGIILLALLHFLAGVWILAAGFVLGHLSGMARQSPATAVMPVVAGGLLLILLGVGLLSGSKWAWWLTAFCQAFSICTGTIALLGALITLARFGTEAAVSAGLYKYLVRTVIGAFIINYLFTENVLGYFRLKPLNTGLALVIVFGLAITLMLSIFGVLAYLEMHGP